jgi:hypothetical protein
MSGGLTYLRLVECPYRALFFPFPVAFRFPLFIPGPRTFFFPFGVQQTNPGSLFS